MNGNWRKVRVANPRCPSALLSLEKVGEWRNLVATQSRNSKSQLKVAAQSRSSKSQLKVATQSLNSKSQLKVATQSRNSKLQTRRSSAGGKVSPRKSINPPPPGRS